MKLTFPMALLLLFIGLKLANVIDWSWWWVMAPLWMPLSVAALALVAVLLARALETPQQKAARLLEEYAKALRKNRG
jgi:membrane protein implicated in regulation of membrane protease activity